MTDFRRNVTCLGALLTFIAGCAVVQSAPSEKMVSDTQPETTPIPLDYEVAANAATGKFVDGWLAAFGVPELDAKVAETIQITLNTRAAAARVDAATAFATQAGAEVTPAVFAGGSFDKRWTR